jgi:3-hydroxyanthranilate 3,4-dioxygenase
MNMSDNTMTRDIGPSASSTSFNLLTWIRENEEKLRPPTAAHTIFKLEDFMITVVGGPNRRTDYHVNPTEEFFFQLRGDMTLRIQRDGKPHDVKISEGSIYALPANVPHSPMRPERTVGLIVERIRKGGQLDVHRWYCEKCNNVLFEKAAHIEVLERDMPPVFESYYANPENQTCSNCSHHNPGRPPKT